MIRTQLPLKIKIPVVILMTVCFAASMISIPRYIALRKWDVKDWTYESPLFTLFSIVELNAAIIAVSLSALRGPFERLLRKHGILKCFGNSSGKSSNPRSASMILQTRKPELQGEQGTSSQFDDDEDDDTLAGNKRSSAMSFHERMSSRLKKLSGGSNKGAHRKLGVLPSPVEVVEHEGTGYYRKPIGRGTIGKKSPENTVDSSEYSEREDRLHEISLSPHISQGSNHQPEE
jgi:hypothetical protein